MKNKLTLLIDGNWLLQSRMSVMMKDFSMENDESVREAAYEELKDRMARSVIVVLNRFRDIDNIVFITDGGSWRKHLPIPTQLTGITYKGNRTRTNEVDWNRIYKSLNVLSDNCEKLGITTSCFSNAEGDDWMWYWSRRLNAQGTNCLIWSSDNDLKQLLQVDNGAFTAWYNDRNGAFFDSTLEEKPMDDLDFFMTMDTKSPLMESIAHVSDTNFIDPQTIILSKIICGDAGDNIKSIIRVSKNNRTYRVSEKDWSKVAETLNIHTIDDLKNKKDAIADELITSKKFRDYNLSHDDIVEMINYNIQLVWLSDKVIPDTVIQAMNQTDYKDYDINYIRSNYKALAGEDSSQIEEIFNNIFN